MKTRKPTTDPTRAVAYIRVSTDEQNLGPAAQLAALEAWAKARGITLVAVEHDLGTSGAAELEKRPGLLAALAALEQHGAGLLVVAKRDRLARDVVLAAMIERLADRVGATVVSAAGEGEGDSPADGLMRRMIDAFAEYERAIIRARTRSALAVKKTRGERTGSVPFGFALAADGVHLIENEAERSIIREIRAMRADGLTLLGIAAALEARGVQTRTGTRWHPQSIARICERAA
ncbi:MAG: recombinase family protein [Planctomycetes bacterium]|nr:recombinase family protein [Planctomycetota bacterium]